MEIKTSVAKQVQMQEQPFQHPKPLLEARSVLNRLRQLLVDFDQPTVRFWIAGGAIQSLIRGWPVNDFDIFSNDPWGVKSAFDALAKSCKPDVFAIGHSNDNFTNYYLDGRQVQLITRFSPSSINATIKMFDFTIVCAAFDGEELAVHPRFYQDVAAQTLVAAYEGPLPFVLSTLERVTKYTQRGYSLCPFLLKKIAMQINQMQIDWDNPSEDAFTFYPDGSPRFTGVD